MATAKITYQGNLRTSAIHLKSGSELITDAPVDNRGKGKAFSPTDLVATALGSCMLTIIGIRANDNGIKLGKIEVEITKIMGDNPRKIDEIIIDIQFLNGHYSAQEKQLLETAAKTCPVALSLNAELKQTVTLSF